MKKEKKRKLIVIAVVAAILLSISTFIFIYYVPSLDSEIDKKQKEIGILLDNQLIYQSYIQTVDLLTNQYRIFEELGHNSTELENIILRRNLETLLLYSHLVYVGEPPTTDEQNNWDSYEINQLVDENSRIQSEGEKQGKGIYKLHQMGEELSELGKRKSLFIGIGTGIQSFGFFLSTLATVVGIHWEEGN
jgi:hypothetical protein